LEKIHGFLTCAKGLIKRRLPFVNKPFRENVESHRARISDFMLRNWSAKTAELTDKEMENREEKTLGDEEI